MTNSIIGSSEYLGVDDQLLRPLCLGWIYFSSEDWSYNQAMETLWSDSMSSKSRYEEELISLAGERMLDNIAKQSTNLMGHTLEIQLMAVS